MQRERSEAYLCCNGAVQRGQDLVNTLDQATESDTNRLRVDETTGESREDRVKEGRRWRRKGLPFLSLLGYLFKTYRHVQKFDLYTRQIKM